MLGHRKYNVQLTNESLSTILLSDMKIPLDGYIYVLKDGHTFDEVREYIDAASK